MQRTERLNLSIVLPLRNQAELTRLLSHIYDPSSPDYRHFLSVKEFTDQFGPSDNDYQKVGDFAKANGFKVTGSSAGRMLLPIQGTVDQVQKAFTVSMKIYRHPTESRTFFSTDREPTVPANLAISHIAGLNNFSRPKPMVTHSASISAVNVAGPGSGPGGFFLASDMRAAYYGGISLTGRGQSVGLLQFDGYDISDVIQAFDGAATLSSSGTDYVVNYTPPNSRTSYKIPIHNVLLDGATGAPGQSYPPANDGEQVLDIVQAIGMAPGLSQVRVYIGSSDVDILSTIASEDLANEVSISWAWTPDDPSAVDQFFEEMAAQGQSVFAASGDYGAYSPSIPYYFPAEDDFVTAVGGTSLTTKGSGGPLVAETAWEQSGGGVSPDSISIPQWQAGISTSSNGASATLRNVPDVAMEADFDNYNCSMGCCSGGWGGTSFASPRWAGFMALVNEQAQDAGDLPVGFINPWIYRTGQSPNYGSEFHDVASGMNDYEPGYGFYSVPGYDLVTGWGSPAGQNLIDAMAPRATAGFQLSTTRSSLTINPGTSATTTLGVTYLGGFSGDVSLAVTSALPSGASASFDTNPTTGTSVLTIAASIFAVTQSNVVTITGTSGALQATTYVTVNTPTNAVAILSPAVPRVPVTAEVFKPGVLIPINATVVGQPRGIHLQWAPGINATSGWALQGIALSQGVTAPFSNSIIGTWDTSSITKAGYYTIQLSADYTEGTVSATTLVYLEPDLISANWPKWLDATPGQYSGIVPFDDNNGNTKLSLVEPVSIGTKAPPRYRVFSPDGSSDQSVTLDFGTYLNPAFGHLLPRDKGEVLMTDARKVILIDSDGSASPLPMDSGANVEFQASQPILADLKGDSSLATVTYGIQTWTQSAFIYAWGSDRQLLNAKFPIKVPYQNTNALFNWNQGVAVGDIDGDGKPEIVALESLSPSTFTFTLFANDGSPRNWTAPTITGVPCQMMLVDLDGNGKLELVVAMVPPPETQTGPTRWALHVLQPDGLERQGWPLWLGYGNPYLAAGDLARTGQEQLVVSSFDQLFVFNGDGTSFSSAWPLLTNGWSPFGPPVLADIDGDGFPEILVANGDLSLLEQPGKILTISTSVPATGQDGLAKTRTQTTATNLSSDMGYFNPVIQAFHRDGMVVRSWRLLGMHGDQPMYTPRLTVGDFNHDGITDIAVVTGLISGGTTEGWITEAVVEVLTTGSAFNSTANDWPMMYRDTHNSALAHPIGPNSPRAAEPTFNLLPGTYTTTQIVAITDSAPGATIYYTTNGATPTTSSNPYSGPIAVSTSETIQAIATASGYSTSAVASVAYTIRQQAATPTFSVAPGTYASSQSVAISDSTPGATIYYTTNGSTSTTSSKPYSGPIAVSTSETIQAIATASGYSMSAVASTTYTITAPSQVTPAVTVTPSSSSVTTAQALSVTVTVNGGKGDSVPTGTVTLTSGSYTSTVTTLSGGTSTIYIPAGSLATGSDILTVTYSGDGNYRATTGIGSVAVVTAVNFSFTVSGTEVSVRPGGTTTNTSIITVTPAGGFVGSVALTASITASPAGAQHLPALSFGTTSPVNITNSNAVSATLTISSMAATSAGLIHPEHTGVPWYAAGGATLTCILLFGIPGRRRKWQTMLGMLVLIVAFSHGMLACGGGGGSGAGGGGGTSNPGTTAGTYTVTVTGTSGTVTTTGAVTITMQ